VCLASIETALSAVEQAAVDEVLLSALYSLPETLLEREGLSGLRAKALAKLLEAYGDAPATIEDEGRRAAFCRLSFQAVRAWVKADHLAVHSENCVVVLLSAWVNANAADLQLSPERLKELSDSVRVEHCSLSYLAQILPNLPLFKADKERINMNLMERVSGKGVLGWGTGNAVKMRRLKEEQGMVCKTLDLSIIRDKLKEKGHLIYPSFYANGFFFKLFFIGDVDTPKIHFFLEKADLLDVLLDKEPVHDEFPNFFVPLDFQFLPNFPDIWTGSGIASSNGCSLSLGRGKLPNAESIDFKVKIQ